MPNYSTNEFKAGLKVLLDSKPMMIIENEFVKPGKGQAFNRVKLRNLQNNRVIEKTFRSGETLPAANVIEIEANYSYHDGEFYVFMDDNFEQYQVSSNAMGEARQWVKEDDLCNLIIFDNVPIVVEPPNFVNLLVAETDPGLKGDTAGTGGKPAKLETGAVIRVPLFVQNNELIKVDTRRKIYVSRVKEDG